MEVKAINKSKSRLQDSGVAVITTLGIMEGEVLEFVEKKGVTTFRHARKELEGSPDDIAMAVGSLVRQGVLRGVQKGKHLYLEPVAS